jgi:hypothetical protein
MKLIPLSKGQFAKVDDEDYDWLIPLKWHLSSNGRAVHSPGILMHRIVIQAPKGWQVDHINHDPLDNRKENLRLVLSVQNMMNRKPRHDKKVIYKGVYQNIINGITYYKATITNNGRRELIGYFKNDRHAAMAYDIWANEIFGQYAYLNFPNLLRDKWL